MKPNAKILILIGLILVIFSLVRSPSLGLKADPGTVHWDGDAGDGLWSNPLNWDNDEVPQSGDSIFIDDAAGEVNLDVDFLLTGPLHINSSGLPGSTLRIKSGVTFSLDDNFLVDPQLYIIEVDGASSIINYGVILGVNSRPYISGEETASFTNHNTVNDIGFTWNGSAVNTGVINTMHYSILGGGTLNNTGSIYDSSFYLGGDAVVINESSGTIYTTPSTIPSGSRFLDNSIFNNYGTLNNFATITNKGIFNNFGTLDNTSGSFVNSCDLDEGVAGIFNDSGSFTGNPIEYECYVWDGEAGNGLWSDPLNWDPDTVPEPGPDKVINTQNGVDAAVTVDVDTVLYNQVALRNITGPPVESSLTIQNGITLSNWATVTAGPYTSIINQGAIVNHRIIKATSCDVEFINNGSLSGNPILGLCATWDGEAGDGLWSNPLNWSEDTLPQSGDSIYISGAAGEVLLDTDFLIVGTLYLSDSGNTLRIKNGVTLTLDSSFDHEPRSLIVAEGTSSIINDGIIQGLSSSPLYRPSISGETSNSFTNHNTINYMSIIWKGSLVNTGTMNSIRFHSQYGILKNIGLIDDSAFSLDFGSVLTNDTSGTINISATASPFSGSEIKSNAILYNYGTLNNLDTITNKNRFHNFGTLNNDLGIFENDYSLISYCDSTLSGLISGNPPLEKPCIVVTNTDDSGPGSLRDAIESAESVEGMDVIVFNIPGSGPHTIRPSSMYPVITQPVIIDGYSQPGSIPGTETIPATLKIELDGSIAGVEADGFNIHASYCTIRGLVINRFGGSGLAIHGSDASTNTIGGNFVGTDLGGNTALGNMNGVLLYEGASNNLIGGLKPEKRNIISGNGDSGIGISGANTTGNRIEGNFIGTNSDGTAAKGNMDGVWLGGGATDNIIGGITPGAGNLISGNQVYGVSINHSGTSGNIVQGNFIGTDASGTAAVGNGGGLLFSDQVSSNLIGGAQLGAGNTIAFNFYDGVLTHSDTGTQNTILSNSMHSNGDLGIDLVGDGVTPNDPQDGDSGPNSLQNFPELFSVDLDISSTVIRGNFNSTPDTTFRLEFFYSEFCDPSGFGEGQMYLGAANTTTDENGNAGFIRTFWVEIPSGSFVTATATDPSGNTSEFSRCIHPVATIFEGGEQNIVLVPIETPFGPQLEITALPDGGLDPALVSLCSDLTTLQFTASDQVIAGCGSAHIEVTQGTVEILIDEGTQAVIPETATVIVDETIEGLLTIENTSPEGTDPVQIVVYGIVVAEIMPGETYEVPPWVLMFMPLITNGG